jgi:hypothetical protein
MLLMRLAGPRRKVGRSAVRGVSGLLMAVCLLGLAACGDSDERAAPASVGENSGAPVGTTTTAATATTTASVGTTTTPAGTGSGLSEKLAAVLAANAPLTSAPGMSLAVRLPGGELVTATHGVAVPGSEEPVRADTMFGAGSVTKTLVATVVMRHGGDAPGGAEGAVARRSVEPLGAQVPRRRTDHGEAAARADQRPAGA